MDIKVVNKTDKFEGVKPEDVYIVLGSNDGEKMSFEFMTNSEDDLKRGIGILQKDYSLEDYIDEAVDFGWFKNHGSDGVIILKLSFDEVSL